MAKAHSRPLTGGERLCRIGRKRFWRSLLISSLIVIFAVVMVKITIVETMGVEGESMLPTYHEGDKVLVLKPAYLFDTPQPDDIVIAVEPFTNVHVIKRVVASPGMSVDYNGKAIVLQDNEYFIRGDNRDNSVDSNTYGPITKERILGKVICKF